MDRGLRCLGNQRAGRRWGAGDGGGGGGSAVKSDRHARRKTLLVAILWQYCGNIVANVKNRCCLGIFDVFYKPVKLGCEWYNENNDD